MSLHVFANFVTPFGTAANNRAETEGNITTLQKLLWLGETHSTVSAEAIRFALRRRLASAESTNREWDEIECVNAWEDPEFKGWSGDKGKTFIDDDLLGFMKADAAKEEGESGSANIRRAVLEVTRAVSLTPWSGDVTFNAASPGATPSAQKKGRNPVPYGTEVHATRYQYGIALTPERLRDKSRAAKAIDALCNLGTVAGNHGRFLFDFSPDVVVLRITSDPAPRLLYSFDTTDNGKTLNADALVKRIDSKDINPKELILGAGDLDSKLVASLKARGVAVFGVKRACEEAVNRINAELKIKG
ncbi:type I-B CRISPR-associated protein Cas7/Cst2/DevR [Lacipirellula parvula]|uniref:CRISPR-associated negative autoregulator Cas7/Cst2 n=1 Tax=Lacipirellula parvula TaxID=2650471 RepID=A0A5K7X5I9_9BACT|nr:type I-B CRISPR-associated protein Cas7/Cst2/DevR [Lacipirellula parvula]BBO31087.1 CRISPR-associated negative autoregulator Cas7/Cst2 [Lacipirellula parvula]